MAASPLRIGIVGAGNNTRVRHIPGFRAIPGVEIVAVSNRRPESTRKVAAEYGIRKTYDHWQDLIADPDIDAVMIGTWPNLHADVTCAALDAGKHVLCEARMASNVAAAQRMLEAANRHPQLVAQIVPSPFGLECGAAVAKLIQDHFVGDLREIIVIGADDQFWDYSRPLHWRQDSQLSGKNILTMGILHETLMRWVPPVKRLYAQSATFEPDRPVPEECRSATVSVPDSVQILGQLDGGASVIYHLSGVTLFGPGKQIHIYGSRGTIKVEFGATEHVLGGHTSDTALQELRIPAEQRGKWRVEEEFVQAIRGEEQVKLTDFATAFKYMQFTEAVHESLQTGLPVNL